MTEFFNRSSEKERRRQLRREMPQAEAILWLRLKNRQLQGFRFRRQYSIGPYVLDFYCPELKLGIEIDGDSHFHAGAQEYDRKRQDFIDSFGIQVLRFLNTDVYESIEGVLETIAWEGIRRRPPPPPPS